MYAFDSRTRVCLYSLRAASSDNRIGWLTRDGLRQLTSGSETSLKNAKDVVCSR